MPKNCVDQNPGYKAYNDEGVQVYPAVSADTNKDSTGQIQSTGQKTPFKVKVSIDDLNIRTGPGTDKARTGKHTGKGIFTIVETASGKGSKSGWGLLKSYADKRNGWVALDYCQRV